jgi:hypothetical protein
VRRKLRRAEVLPFFAKLPLAWSAWRHVADHTTGRARLPLWGMMFA